MRVNTRFGSSCPAVEMHTLHPGEFFIFGSRWEADDAAVYLNLAKPVESDGGVCCISAISLRSGGEFPISANGSVVPVTIKECRVSLVHDSCWRSSKPCGYCLSCRQLKDRLHP